MKCCSNFHPTLKAAEWRLFPYFILFIISLPAISFDSLAALFTHLHSKSSFKYTSFVLSIAPIFHNVSILEESSKNCKIFSAFKVSSAALIISTDSLNHSAIFILCPAIHSQIKILASLSASASFTIFIF
ncbi:MAG: hypothetical protein LBF15_01100 [Candidatus Peribacteria bacterium]|nr:hypothetical protein [Candidatus Peribacteria bacterium]